MTQWVKILATKLGNQSWISKTHIVEGENRFP